MAANCFLKTYTRRWVRSHRRCTFRQNKIADRIGMELAFGDRIEPPELLDEDREKRAGRVLPCPTGGVEDASSMG